MNAAPDSRVFRIFLAEDNEADVYLLRLALKKAQVNADLIVVTDGAAALAFGRDPWKQPGGALPDLALLDLNLPKKNGAEVLEAMRLNPELADVPIVILTSSFSPLERAKMEKLGVARYLTKPPDLDGYMRIGGVVKEILLERAEAQATKD